MGINRDDGKIHVSYSSASVNASAPGTVQNIGGLVGVNLEEIMASYATGNVGTFLAVTQSNLGGLAGSNSGTVQASYSIGTFALSASTNRGGLVGLNTGTVTHSYYDRDTSGQSDTGKGEPKTTADLKEPTGYTGIYTNWNLDVDGDAVGGDSTPDNPWRFKPGKYPELGLGSVGVTGIELVSRPASGDTFRDGELITVRVTFTEPVVPVGRRPGLTLHSQDGWFRRVAVASVVEGQQYRTIDFTHRVQPGDSVIDKLVAGTHEKYGGGLVLEGSTLKGESGVPVPPDVTAVTFDYRVDCGELPRPEFGGAIGECREVDITLGPWSDRYELWRQWGVGCDSRSHPGHHAMYYTFTLENASRVRLHVEGSSAYGATPLMILRQGRSYSGEELRRGSEYTVPYIMRIDEVLAAGTYTLEVATSKPGITGHAFRLRMGIPATPPADDSWRAELTVRQSGSELGCSSLNVCRSELPAFKMPVGDSLVDRQLAKVAVSSSNLSLQIWQTTPRVDLERMVLYVDGRAFAFADAMITRLTSVDEVKWSNANLDWSVGDVVSLSLSVGPLCFQEVGPDDSYDHTGQWPSTCASASNPGSHAVYYSYTPDANGATTFTLTSPDAEEELYLWDGDRLIDQHSSNNAACLNKCARITQWLTAEKTYTIEVTSDGASAGGYLLALRRTLLFTKSTREPADAPTECLTTVDVEQAARFQGNAGGVFGFPCHSVAKAGHYARYYTFTLSEARDVRIELYGSGAAGASLYLRDGNLGSGPHMAESHNPADTAVRARMDGHLPAGTYTVEAVGIGPGDGGIFNIVIKQGPSSWRPPDECVHQITVGTGRTGFTGTDPQRGVWGEPCWSNARTKANFPSHRGNSHARWFTFTLTEAQARAAGEVRIELSADAIEADAYLYLRAGETFTGFALAENDDERPYRWRSGWQTTDSTIEMELEAGTYTVEATTDLSFWPGNAGTFGMTWLRK